MLRHACLASAVLIAVVGPVHAEEANRGATQRDSQRTAASMGERIDAALEAPVVLEFVDTPLVDIAQFLAEYQQIIVQLDTKALEEAGIAADMPVTAQISGIPLRNALNVIFRGTGLTWIVRDEVLWFLTIEKADTMLEVRVYPVQDLLRPAESILNEKRKFQADYNPLVDAIVSSVAPHSWADQGGMCSIAAFPHTDSLVVYQTYQAHREIERLLHDLRLAREASQ